MENTQTNVQAHRQASENLETLTEANACSVQCSCSALDSTVDVGSEGSETIEVTVNLNQDGFVGVMYAVSDDLGPKSNYYVQTKVDEIEWQKFLRGEKKSLVFKVDPDALKHPPTKA